MKKKETMIGKKLKNYLNADEQNRFLFFLITKLYMGEHRDTLTKYGNITKEEHKYLKMSETYMKKYVGSVVKRMSEKQNEFFQKKITGGYEIKIMDKYTLDRLQKGIGEDIKMVHIDREVFETWTEEVMYATCKGCTKDHATCSLHTIFLENFIPEPVGLGQSPTCRYAYEIMEENKNV